MYITYYSQYYTNAGIISSGLITMLNNLMTVLLRYNIISIYCHDFLKSLVLPDHSIKLLITLLKTTLNIS